MKYMEIPIEFLLSQMILRHNLLSQMVFLHILLLRKRGRFIFSHKWGGGYSFQNNAYQILSKLEPCEAV